MSWLSQAIKKVAPIVATVSPEPISRAVASVATLNEQKKQADYNKKLLEQRRLEQQKAQEGQFMEIFGSTPGAVRVPPYNPPISTQNSGFVSDVSSFFKGAGEVISSAFGSGLPQLFGVGTPKGIIQQPAISTQGQVGGQESQGSGSIQAGMGSLLPGLIGAGRGLLKSPLGQLAVGTGAGFGVSMIGADGKTMRVTRKMKSQARMLLNMTGGNLQATADILGISQEQLVFILLKRFRNDGPVVTKAALRKTRSTIRKMKGMCDMYDDLRPTARRRTPMRRARSSTTTLIKN